MSQQVSFQQERLPAGFRYPQAYLDLAQAPERLANSSWWLIGSQPEYANFCLDLLLGMGGGKVLIPFAKDDASGDIACFDGSDQSSSHRVYFHVGEESFDAVNWETRYSQTFAEWLEEALGSD